MKNLLVYASPAWVTGRWEIEIQLAGSGIFIYKKLRRQHSELKVQFTFRRFPRDRAPGSKLPEPRLICDELEHSSTTVQWPCAMDLPNGVKSLGLTMASGSVLWSARIYCVSTSPY